jgi:hypothetical protein
MLPSIPRQMVPRTFKQRQDAFIEDLLDRLYPLRNRIARGGPTIEQSIDDFRRAGQAFRRSNRVSPQQRVTKEIERNRNMIKNIGDSIGKDTGKGYKEVDIQDLIDFLSGKN